MSSPVRSCIGCRGRGDKAELIRMVTRDGAVVVDPTQTMPGRGAYLHRRPECLHRALKRGTVGRTLRAPVDPVQAEQALGAVISVSAPAGPDVLA